MLSKANEVFLYCLLFNMYVILQASFIISLTACLLMLIRCKEDVYSIVYNYLVIMYVPCVNIVYIIYTFKIFFNF